MHEVLQVVEAASSGGILITSTQTYADSHVCATGEPRLLNEELQVAAGLLVHSDLVLEVLTDEWAEAWVLGLWSVRLDLLRQGFPNAEKPLERGK